MKDLLTYRGYHAKISFDAEDMIFVGTVLGLRYSLHFHGTTIQELVSMFHQSIDNYLDMCRALGKSPDKEFKGTFNVRVDPDLQRRASEAALQQGVTLNQDVQSALEQAVSRA